MQSSKLFTPSRSCWVGFAVFCSLWFPATASAQMTQAQMTQAFYDALMQWGEDTTGEEGVPYVFAVDDRTLQSLAYYLDSQGGHTGVGNTSYQILRMLYGDRPEFYNNLRSLIPTNELLRIENVLAGQTNNLEGLFYDVANIERHLDADNIGEFANSVVLALYDDSSGSPYLAKIRNLTYTQGLELRVHDEDANETLASMLNQLRGMETFANGAANTVTNALYRIQHQNEEYWDQDPGSTVSQGERAAQQQVDETNAYVDDLIDETEPYEPTPEETEPPEDNPVGSDDDTTQLTNVSTPTHSTNLKLLNQQTMNIGTARPIRLNFPTMEYDMSGDGVADFVATAGGVCSAFWTALFSVWGFLLWYRGMQQARQMLLHARIGSIGQGINLDVGAMPGGW